MEIKKAIEILEDTLKSFYEYPDFDVLSDEDCQAIETLIEFAKEKY